MAAGVYLPRGRNEHEKTMGSHFLLSPSARNFTLKTVEKMSSGQVHEFFIESRWGKTGTQVCPMCGSITNHYYVKSRRQWRCREAGCGTSFSVTTGTKFADHKLPLKTILMGMVLFTTNVKGISACAMSRTLGVAYMTAFTLVHKLRESIMENADKSPLDGLIHIDGAHVSGRKRKPRVKVKHAKYEARTKLPFSDDDQHPNRRIVMVMRQVDPKGGTGSIRTIVEVVRAENAEWANKLAKKYISKGANVMTDESNAYSEYMARYKHETVNHSNMFSTDDGVNNNQAESYFSRMRRMVIGQVHRVTPKYMLDYVSEVAWREDIRRTPTSVQVKGLLGMALKKRSRWWCGYWQRHHRAQEIMFV